MTGSPLTVVAPIAVPPLRADPPSGVALSVSWLGQAGFVVDAAGVRLVLDPYLSDSLAEKYRGKPFPHLRMMPPPISPGMLREVDLVLASHAHTDHLDPGTLGPLAAGNPGCRFVVPTAHASLAVSRGVPADRLLPAAPFRPLDLPGVRIHPLPSAHETLAVDAAGNHLFMGYVIELPGATLYHPGDCVPYPELPSYLDEFAIDLALLPVNGRDAARAAGGIPGNFTLEETFELSGACAFRAVIGHHIGLFDFNTIDVAEARAKIAARSELPTYLLAEAGVRYDLTARPAEQGARTHHEA